MMNFIRKHKHSLLLLYFPVYLAAFFTIDRLPLKHHMIVCGLDRFIPFNEYMVIPYALWFFWFPGWVFLFFWLSVKDEFCTRKKDLAEVRAEAALAVRDFVKLAVVMFTSMTICLIIYCIWPNAIDLREPITGTNLCAKAVQLIREADTPYGVCPSIHIATIIAEILVIRDSRLKVLTPTVKHYSYIITALITWSTMAIKQHSIVDVIAGALLAWALYRVYKRHESKFELLYKTETGHE